MAKTVKTTVTKTTTVTTEVTTTKYAPTCYMPLDLMRDGEDAKKYYEDRGIPVVTINRYGVKQQVALVPAEDYEKGEAFSRSMDSHRRKMERKAKKVKKHEKASLEGFAEAGYDPTLDAYLVPLTFEDDDLDTEDEIEEGFIEDYSSMRNPCVSRGGYVSSSDDDNPETIYAKKVLMDELRKIIDEAEGEDAEIIQMILTCQTEREKAAELGMAQTTLNSKKKKLFEDLRARLEEFYY